LNRYFPSLVGQERAVAALEAALAAPSHAYLFVGPPKVGKTTAATAWARALLCRGGVGCGNCNECRTFDHGQHVDFRLWEPAGRSTSIEQIRELVRQAELAPYRGTRQVHVVVSAQTLSMAAANCLLKTLEEPAPGTIIVLLAPSAGDVLPTIVSRCCRIAFRLVPAQIIADWLVREHGLAADQAVVAARRSGGRIGHALATLAVPPAPPQLLEASDPLAAQGEAERAASLPPEQQLLLLGDLTLLARDALVLAQTGRESWVTQAEDARRLLATGRSARSWPRILSLLESTRRCLEGGANAKLTWAVMAHELVGIR
jgi:DNA polymerase-3 subunit delta'